MAATPHPTCEPGSSTMAYSICGWAQSTDLKFPRSHSAKIVRTSSRFSDIALLDACAGKSFPVRWDSGGADDPASSDSPECPTRLPSSSAPARQGLTRTCWGRRNARELEALEKREQRDVDRLRRLLLHPVPGARKDDLRAEVLDPPMHGGRGHEAAHGVELAGEEERGLHDVAI